MRKMTTEIPQRFISEIYRVDLRLRAQDLRSSSKFDNICCFQQPSTQTLGSNSIFGAVRLAIQNWSLFVHAEIPSFCTNFSLSHIFMHTIV